MLRLLLGLVYSGVIACWVLALMFGIYEVKHSLKKWYLPDSKMFGKKVVGLYLADKLLWLGAGIGIIAISLIQLKLVWGVVLKL